METATKPLLKCHVVLQDEVMVWLFRGLMRLFPLLLRSRRVLVPMVLALWRSKFLRQLLMRLIRRR